MLKLRLSRGGTKKRPVPPLDNLNFNISSPFLL